MPNSRSSSRCSSVASYRPPSDPPPGIDPNDGRGDEIQPCPVGFHPMAHTPPPPPSLEQMPPPPPKVKERRLPSRSGSTASLFSPFASLTRRLGAKHKSSKTTHGRMSTPVEFPGVQHGNNVAISRSVTPASVYSTFPRIHSSSSSTTPSPSGRTPFISQLLAATSNSSSSTAACPSCPSPGPSYSSSSTGYPPMMMTEVLDEPVEEEVRLLRCSHLHIGPLPRG